VNDIPQYSMTEKGALRMQENAGLENKRPSRNEASFVVRYNEH